MKNLLWLLVGSCLLFSCSTKKVTYFQLPDEIEEVPLDSAYYSTTPPSVNKHVLDVGDVLAIEVATIDPTAAEEFSALTEAGAFAIHSTDGTIPMPYHGKLKVQGLTLKEARDEIVKVVDQYYNNAKVTVELLSFRIILLGELIAPGVKIVNNKQINLIEAIGLAGDISNYGNKQDVRIIRNYPEKPQVFKVDLTNMNVFNSKVFYLQSNDIIYVKPVREKKFLSNIQYVNVFLAVANTTILLFNILSRN